MFFLNLSLVEFLALASAVSALIVALYLLDRSRRRQIVATLRFWNVTENVSQPRRRRRIRQPWSLLLQLVSVLLLLAALAGLRWGSAERVLRDHVILLDTSAWMAARGRAGSLLDEAKTAAIAYVRALPSSDRVMIVRADAMATPVTRFESDRAALEEAIRQDARGRDEPEAGRGHSVRPAGAASGGPRRRPDRLRGRRPNFKPGRRHAARHRSPAPASGKRTGRQLRSPQAQPAPCGQRPGSLGDLRSGAKLRPDAVRRAAGARIRARPDRGAPLRARSGGGAERHLPLPHSRRGVDRGAPA